MNRPVIDLRTTGVEEVSRGAQVERLWTNREGMGGEQ